MSALPIHKLTPEEYLALDRDAELKSEYHDGELFPVAAASFRHARLVGRGFSAIESRLRGKDCAAAVSPLRVRVSPTQFVYPDIAVVCGKPQFTDEQVDTITNPKVIVEVLSPSTQDYDYGGKFGLYRRLASLQEYVLVSQDEVKVEVFRKQTEMLWTFETIAGAEATLRLDSLGVEVPLAEVYEGILP